MKIGVVGAGSWGTALAVILARRGHGVTLFGRDDDDLESMRESRENRDYLPGITLPDSMEFSRLVIPDPAVDFWVIAVPSFAVRESLAPLSDSRSTLVLASKGIEPGTGKLMAEVAQEICPNAVIAALSGPNLAREVVLDVPTATLVACPDESIASTICEAFHAPAFRAYYTDDLVGIELCGALKNVLAIGAGISDGLGYGDNTKGALLARGLREMVVLGTQMGARMETFFGIAGVGDLFATASSTLSRNYRCGLGLGNGSPLDAVLAEIGQVVEGVETAKSLHILMEHHGVDLPIMGMIHRVILGEMRARDAVGLLMDREPRREVIGG